MGMDANKHTATPQWEMRFSTLEYQQGYADALNGKSLEKMRGVFTEHHWKLYQAGFIDGKNLREIPQEESGAALANDTRSAS
jgi:hypothetical protein